MIERVKGQALPHTHFQPHVMWNFPRAVVFNKVGIDVIAHGRAASILRDALSLSSGRAKRRPEGAPQDEAERNLPRCFSNKQSR
jgi:hypothetical protein